MDLPLQNTVVMPDANPGQPVPPVAPQTDSHTPFLVLVLLVSLVISTIAVFLFWQNQQLRNQLTSATASPSPTASAVALASADPTASWQTYTNANYQFSLKHPSSLTLAETTQGKELIIAVKGLAQNISLVVDPIGDHNFYIDKTVSNTLTYNGINWKYLTVGKESCDGGMCDEISDALQTENQTYRYTFVLGSLPYPDPVLDQILSTFKFTN